MDPSQPGRRPAHRATGAFALTTLLAAVLAAGCGGAPGGSEQGSGTTASDTPGGGSTGPTGRLVPPGEPETVATGLEVPWGIAALPSGGALATERDSGRVIRVADDGRVSEVGTVAGVRPRGEGGLLGIALDPYGERPEKVYVYYTARSDNRIARIDLEWGRDGDLALGESRVLVKGIPAADHHNGGQLAFGPDGLLYAATGDAGRESRAQDTGDLGGKILRMTPDGRPADGNPFDNLVYSYGHRNVQGLAWGPEDVLFATEFGQDTYDEVNVIEAGGNYGWPEVEGVGGPDAPDDLVDPVVTWTTEESSPSGAAVAGGSLWVAALRGERLWRMPLTGQADTPLGEPEALFTGEYGRLRAVVPAPGGAGLWAATSNRDGRGDPAADDDRVLRVPLEEDGG
ncbi:PQQ-dependent sugar dehydrogenase [Streptomonospora sp. S1-112]|uniref:PQQ-dependent sugar dehydrogenase n=1 Tax=Streptomonospora mangrovi TaxID=2883123 RepID=A0A9X3SKT7_9ACTN|nr:PQQ-dependent sugar dehydrogenase [Streptomonospora mangrovi]MDA0563096.1 PQQ-dependent sugar dehydrogenase [Streptomonospora mangrovi]